MSKKPFDHIENKIKEAAGGSEPAFEEQAWVKMEALLDKEAGRKRPLFVWWKIALPLLFITTGITGAWYFNMQSTQKKSTALSALQKEAVAKDSKMEEATEKIAAVKTSDAPAQNSKQEDVIQNDFSGETVENKVAEKPVMLTKNGNSNAVKALPLDRQMIQTNKALSKKIKRKTKASIQVNTNSSIPSEAGEPADGAVAKDKNPIISADTKMDVVKDTIGHEKMTTATIDGKITDSAKLTVADKKENEILSSSKKEEKKKRTIESKFYLLAGGGAEASGVKMLACSNSTIKAKYGIGIGYQLSKKISVQTGFYAGTKKYTGGPEDYHTKPGSYWSMVHLDKIDAACMVYDIPVTIRYNFIQKPATVYYATAGISSFIMKKEAYDYYYTAYNYPYQKSYTYTGNKNLFSILTFSVGIEKKISQAFSVQAEPYLSIPLAGVGDGSVKLYSAGLQLGIKYSPFFK